jgi:hypothetical protein
VGLLYQPRMIDEYGAGSGKRIGGEISDTWRKPVPMTHRPPQSAHDLTWGRTRAAAKGSRRLTARVIWYGLS